MPTDWRIVAVALRGPTGKTHVGPEGDRGATTLVRVHSMLTGDVFHVLLATAASAQQALAQIEAEGGAFSSLAQEGRGIGLISCARTTPEQGLDTVKRTSSSLPGGRAITESATRSSPAGLTTPDPHEQPGRS